MGDPHAEQSELEDCQALVDLICEHVKLWKPDAVVFLGDQHHNHALVHLEVLGFWKAAFEKIKDAGQKFGTKVITLVGNHDMPGNGTSKNHAMLAYDIVVADKVLYSEEFACISYCATEEEFRGLVAQLPEYIKTLFVHQTFDGSKYENGFYAKDGFSLEGLEKYKIFSGHIHTPQDIANVTYVGAPRWRTVSDANIERFLWCLEIEDGVPNVAGKIPTSTVCEPMYYFIDRQSEPLDIEGLKVKGQIIIDIHGAPEWIAERTKIWHGTFRHSLPRVRTFPVTENTGRVLESKGIHVALAEFLDSYNPSESINKDEFRGVVNKRLGLTL